MKNDGNRKDEERQQGEEIDKRKGTTEIEGKRDKRKRKEKGRRENGKKSQGGRATRSTYSKEGGRKTGKAE